jgi:hypothetical protein
MSIWIFGGVDRNGALYDELWKGELVRTAKESYYSFTRVKYSDGPQPRAGAVLLSDVSGQRLVLFGGVGQKGELLNDVWTFDVAKAKWQKASVKIPDTVGLYEANYEASGGYGYIFGGFSLKSEAAELYRLDLNQLIFQRYDGKEREDLLQVFGAGISVDSDKNALLFYDGYSGEIRNDVYALDFGNGNWVKL